MPINFVDPIHGAIHVPDRYTPLIHSPAIARLRNVRQLGFTLSSYPGAVHTRFEHTLGTVGVLDRLLSQFGIRDAEQRQPYILNALLTEIGIYPMSYSTRSIFSSGEDGKSAYSEMIYSFSLERDIGVCWSEVARFSDPNADEHAWFRAIPGMNNFQYLSPVKLASTIDYALRDSYYSGRFRGAFDYRFFGTIDLSNIYEAERNIASSLKELHRAVHALNSIYGDRTRRFLTAVLARLVARLTESGYLNIEHLKSPNVYIELDDDVFFATVGSATRRAENAGDDLGARMFQIVSQKRSVAIQSVELENEIKGLDTAELEAEIARKEGLPPAAVFCLGDQLRDEIGFRLFGREFGSYGEAVRSDHFLTLTGLAEPDDRTGLERPNTVSYVLI